ncbi:carboxylate-amine ligase [Tunturiibacter gelidiferens]|uniref:carboxylate-amine ligase n=1 Tax=Tunturiibacter gelidiferens TaxID=3069689 RepID=UPI003D9B23B2
MRPSFTLGIEEEYQTVDPETRDLRSHIATEMLAKGKLRLEERVKAEMHQSVIEVGTRVCSNIQVAQEDLFDLRRNMIALAEEHDLLLIAGATHPFADWRVQEIYPDPRYAQVVEDLQLVARANLIFGLHVHVGIEDREAAIRIMNSLRYFLPHILALSTNSPSGSAWRPVTKATAPRSSKTSPAPTCPTASPATPSSRATSTFSSRPSPSTTQKIWWDVRPHPFFDTVEVRICDIPLRAHESIAIAALIQATACKLWHLHSRNVDYRQYSRALLMENKFRAVRYGLDGKMIDFGKEAEVPVRALILEYLAFVDDVLDELGSRTEISYIHTMLREGSGADRQLKVFRETGSLRSVVDYMAAETRAGL